MKIFLSVLLLFISSQTILSQDVVHDSIALSRQENDSLTIQKLTMQVQELKLSQIILLNEKMSKGIVDSVKRERQKKLIDSLRAITKGVPIIIEKDTLFSLYARRGGVMPTDRVEKAQAMILAIGKELTFQPDSVYVYNSEFISDIMAGDKVIISFTDQDALWQNTTKEQLANDYLPIISNKILELHSKYGLQEKIKAILFFIGVIVIQTILIYFTIRLSKKVRVYIKKVAKTKFKAITIKEYEFLDIYKQVRILVSILNIVKYVLILVQLLISLSILFSIFPETERYAFLLLSYIWDPTKDIIFAIVNFIPSVFKILLIYLFFKYIVRGLKYIANEIATEKLKINGFYSDWAFPTYYILRFLLYSFMIIMIWPLLPNSSSPIFQGVSVFIGLIISLGSTTVIGNLMAGLVITYMRPFKTGDQIRLNDTVGSVIEKTPFVTRIRTPKNEVITIPNSFILSSQTVNYTTSAENYGLIIHTDVTVGYDVPHQQVRQLLIEAASKTTMISKSPAPFVLIIDLSDFYCSYQINAYTKEDQKLPKLYSELRQNIIDKFNEAGIEIMSPHFYAQRNGDEIMIPAEYKDKNRG